MVLGCCYNLFDGEELLLHSVKSIRNCADYIVVIYQDVSNYGNFSSIELLPLLNDLKEKKIIDDFVKYFPMMNLKGHGNEIAKRNMGMEKCQEAGCTHFMTMDVDEFYKESELNFVKEFVETDKYDSSACQMQTYYKTAEWAITPPESYYVPLIYKIDERKFNLNVRWPISADPTRRLDSKKLMIFMRDKIEMHHMSYVRKDIRAKLNNSSANVNWKNRIEELANYHDNWTPIKMARFAGSEERLYDIRQVPNYFNINI
jgi:hypothetical protein